MEICIIRKQERVDLLLGQGCEGSIKIVHSAGSHNMNLQSERERGLLHVFDMGLGIRESRVHKHADCAGLGQQLM
jgi:hypothetical protein